MDCKQKITFHSAAIAEDARQGFIAAHKADRRNARLTVYTCHHCGKFHLGHLRRESKPQPVPEPKQPTARELRRAEKHTAKKAERKSARALQYAD
jgi:hypothetical protein